MSNLNEPPNLKPLIEIFENLLKPSGSGINTSWKSGRLAGIAECLEYVKEQQAASAYVTEQPYLMTYFSMGDALTGNDRAACDEALNSSPAIHALDCATLKEPAQGPCDCSASPPEERMV